MNPFQKKVTIIITVVVIIVVLFWFSRPTEYESIRVTPESRVDDTEKGQILILYIQNTGALTAEIYSIGCAYNFTFTSDIVIPPGVEAIVSFPKAGGPVTVETISGPDGEEATCGGEAISAPSLGMLEWEEENQEEWKYDVGTSYSVQVYTRSGGYYTHEQIVRVYEY